ncbi:MAG: (Fe-S)-binding protein [Deltaproteobacteria bacterium]|nr:(Fe-S)-binding protein [Deltaproteobacteria bacterium]
MAKNPEYYESLNIDYKPPRGNWMDRPVDIKKGIYCYPARPVVLENVGMNDRSDWGKYWVIEDEDWELPDDWKERFLNKMRDMLGKYRTFKIYMDICVRCGACADKCHYFLGSGDPLNMPVMRAELLRSIYRGEFTKTGKMLGSLVGARKLTKNALKQLWYYMFQCSECRRCSVFCPYGIDTAEITIMGREIMNELGMNIAWVQESVSKCIHTGNHLGLQPQAYKECLDAMMYDIEDNVGISFEPTFNRKGAEILFVTPSGDVFADPGIFTLAGYLMLFEHLGLDYTWSTYASEGGDFGYFTANEMAKRMNGKIYAEAKRLGVKWILGGECGHMWRVLNQYMTTWHGPINFLEEPVSPITGTKFENAKAHKMVHIMEFVADLIKHNKLKLDPSRNDHLKVTYHDSCNPARAMGLLEEPRYVIKNVCNNFYEMPENTIREQTYCCGSGSGLNASENMELRLRGGFPRQNALRYVADKYGVNMMACICAIDRAALPPAAQYWNPDVGVTGVTELVANALIMEGEGPRTHNLRGFEIATWEPEP